MTETVALHPASLCMSLPFPDLSVHGLGVDVVVGKNVVYLQATFFREEIRCYW